MSTLSTWLRGLALLRFPEMVKHLGEQRFRILAIEEVRRDFPASKLSSDLILIGYHKGLLTLSDGAQVCSGSILAFGDDLNGFGRISIGHNAWIGQYNNLRAGGGDIAIGADCLISQFCSLVASNHSLTRGVPMAQQPPASDRSGIRLGNDVWLGAGVNVLPGSSIGNGSVIGAGSVVSGEVPEYQIWAGAPARKIGER